MPYPLRPHHEIPSWVGEGALFHIRIRVSRCQDVPLTKPTLGIDLLRSAERYHQLGHWWCRLFLLMPDHLHAMLCFPRGQEMSRVVSAWKKGTARFQRVRWQEDYFDHRIRHEKEADEKWRYIRRNPVARGIVSSEENWPWWWSALTPARLLDSAAGRGP
jgi:putative transposase